MYENVLLRCRELGLGLPIRMKIIFTIISRRFLLNRIKQYILLVLMYSLLAISHWLFPIELLTQPMTWVLAHNTSVAWGRCGPLAFLLLEVCRSIHGLHLLQNSRRDTKAWGPIAIHPKNRQQQGQQNQCIVPYLIPYLLEYVISYLKYSI